MQEYNLWGQSYIGYGKITKEESERRAKLFENGIKVCSHCKEEKPIDDFCKDSATKDGYGCLCKLCRSQQRIKRKDKIQEWFDKNAEYIKEYNKEYSKEHSKEKHDYNELHKEYFKQKRKEYEANNKDKLRLARKKQDAKLTSRYKKYKRGAEERNLEFTLSLEEFDAITSKPCFYCGEIQKNEFGEEYSGIDRIDTNAGYVDGNIVPCCKMCNQMKMAYSAHDWIIKMHKILNNLKENGYPLPR